MLLSNLSEGRDNNFNLIRVIAALAVLVTHSFALATGDGGAEPLRLSLNITIGEIAVDVFFITSGFLVTASLLKRKSTIEFVWARILRIYPALWTMLFLTALILGSLLSDLPSAAYFSSFIVYKYIIKSGTLILGAGGSLPGVYVNNPWPGAPANGSLWTLPYELKMYMGLAMLWLLFKLLKSQRLNAFKYSIFLIFLFSGSYILIGYFYNGLPLNSELHKIYPIQGLAFMFFTGSVFYLLKDKIRLRPLYFYAAVLVLVFSTFNRHVFYVAYILTIAYILFYVAYIPRGAIRKYNFLGDYSYGVYIYAWPVQQTVIHFTQPISAGFLILYAAPITILFAVLSWHYVERHALKQKSRVIGHTNMIFNLFSRIKTERE